MNNLKQPPAQLRKRKMMLVLPLLVIPFLTMAFWALGGGKGNSQPVTSESSKGLNTRLPDAHLKEEKLLDKLGFYNKADKDSAKLAEWMRSDPYYQQKQDSTPEELDQIEQISKTSASKHNQWLNLSPYDQPKKRPEEELLQKLSTLQQHLETNTSVDQKADKDDTDYSSHPEFTDQVSKLEAMMNQMGSGSEEDPEIKQLSGMMDKILDIQHPERIKQRIKEKQTDELSNVLSVSSTNGTDTAVNGFFGMENETTPGSANAIQAVVNENQVLVNGSVIKLRLLTDIFIKGSKIPAGLFVFGLVSLKGERLEIEINSIRCGASLFPVKMQVYDMDGISGIYIPGAITRDVAKQSTDNGMQTMELATLDPSLKAQVAATGLNTAKSLLTRKVKLIKVTVKAGYKVLLTDKSTQQ